MCGRGGKSEEEKVQKSVLEYLENALRLVPEKLLFTDDRTEWTYAEFAGRAKRIGSALARVMEGRTRQPVAVMSNRSVQPLAGFFGAVYSGNFYVPIDSRMPAERISLMLKTLGAKVLVAGEGDRRLLGQLDFDGKVCFLDELAQEPLDQPLLDRIAGRQTDTDPLYAIFTSGSTGVPKGVLVSHRSVIDLTDQFLREFAFDETSVFGNQAPFDFDVSVKDIYSALCCRGTMHVIPQVKFSFPVKLIEYLNEKKINTIIWAVSALRIIENLDGFSTREPETLRLIMFSGEVMPVKVLNYWRRHLPQVQYVNLYGPTEITCNCTFYKVDREFADDETLPIGRPFANCEVFLLNGDEAVEAGTGRLKDSKSEDGGYGNGEPGNNGYQDGEPGDGGLRNSESESNGESLESRGRESAQGEICVRGTCLALGYYNAPEKTAEAFCQNPLNQSYPERIYRTGDIGRYDAQGLLYFVSRKDAQIKHMGHRIELGEVEAAVNALPYIDAGICLYLDDRIVLCYQCGGACEKELLRDLGKKLPKYMLPTQCLWYGRLPLNKHGKIDRVLLRQELSGEG